AVDGPEVAPLVGPLVPDGDAVLLEVADVGRALQEPEELVDDGLHEELLGGDGREAPRQVEAHLVPEDAEGAGAGAVPPRRALVADAADEVQVLLHVRAFRPQAGWAFHHQASSSRPNTTR